MYFANKSHCIPLCIKNRTTSSTYILSEVKVSKSHFGSFLLIFVINLAQKADCLFHNLHHLRRWFVFWAKERHSVLRILVLKAESQLKLSKMFSSPFQFKNKLNQHVKIQNVLSFSSLYSAKVMILASIGLIILMEHRISWKNTINNQVSINITRNSMKFLNSA